MVERESEGFLLIRSRYRVRCLQCGWRGEANLGSEPIVTEEYDGADWCPVCGHLALVGDEEKG